MWPLFFALACGSEPAPAEPVEPQVSSNSDPVATFAQPTFQAVELPVEAGQDLVLPEGARKIILDADPELQWSQLSPHLQACRQARVEPWLRVQKPDGSHGWVVPLRPALRAAPGVERAEWTVAFEAKGFRSYGLREGPEVDLSPAAVEAFAADPSARVSLEPRSETTVQELLAALDALASAGFEHTGLR